MILTPAHQKELEYFVNRLNPVSKALPGPGGSADALTTTTISLGDNLVMEVVVTEPGRYAVSTGSRIHFASESARGYAWIVVEIRHKNSRTAVGGTLSMKYIDLGMRDNLARALACALKEFLSSPELAGRFSLAAAKTSKELVVRGESI
jgi:hypothetical protein